MRFFSKLELALALGAIVSAALLPTTAGAQGGFLEDRAPREGPGFKVGRLVLHPGLSLQGGYDSNVFLQSSGEEGSFILRLEGYLDVATVGAVRRAQGEANALEPQKIEFRGGVGGRYYHYFSGRVADNVGADANADFSYNPSKVFTLQLRDDFTRTIRPFSNPNTTSGTTISYGRNINAASLALVGRSKSQVLEGSVGYTNYVQLFDAGLYTYGNTMSHHVPVSLSWRFFPSSALVYTVEYINQTYLNPEQVLASPTSLSNNNRVLTLIGYNGAITERTLLTAMIGYTAGFYEAAQNFDAVIARVDLSWRPRATIVFTTGFDRNVHPSFIGNYTTINRLRANARFTLAGALDVGMNAWVSFDKSGPALSPDGAPIGNQLNREDTRLQAALFAEYRFKAWLALFSEIGYLADFTDFRYLGTGPLIVPYANYQRFEAWLGLRVFY
ncbi:MAG: hypothetical protein WCF10_17685 [Polyangiales bacterium]